MNDEQAFIFSRKIISNFFAHPFQKEDTDENYKITCLSELNLLLLKILPKSLSAEFLATREELDNFIGLFNWPFNVDIANFLKTLLKIYKIDCHSLSIFQQKVLSKWEDFSLTERYYALEFFIPNRLILKKVSSPLIASSTSTDLINPNYKSFVIENLLNNDSSLLELILSAECFNHSLDKSIFLSNMMIEMNVNLSNEFNTFRHSLYLSQKAFNKSTNLSTNYKYSHIDLLSFIEIITHLLIQLKLSKDYSIKITIFDQFQVIINNIYNFPVRSLDSSEILSKSSCINTEKMSLADTIVWLSTEFLLELALYAKLSFLCSSGVFKVLFYLSDFVQNFDLAYSSLLHNIETNRNLCLSHIHPCFIYLLCKMILNDVLPNQEVFIKQFFSCFNAEKFDKNIVKAVASCHLIMLLYGKISFADFIQFIKSIFNQLNIIDVFILLCFALDEQLGKILMSDLVKIYTTEYPEWFVNLENLLINYQVDFLNYINISDARLTLIDEVLLNDNYIKSLQYYQEYSSKENNIRHQLLTILLPHFIILLSIKSSNLIHTDIILSVYRSHDLEILFAKTTWSIFRQKIIKNDVFINMYLLLLLLEIQCPF